MEFTICEARNKIEVFMNNGGGVTIQEVGMLGDDDSSIAIPKEAVKPLIKALQAIYKELED